MENKNRRTFIKNSLGLTTGLLMTQVLTGSAVPSILGGADKFRFAKAALPYGYADLEPAIDAQTMQIHYERHYNNYVVAANEAIEAEKVDVKQAQDLLRNISKYSGKLRNNAGGAYNHELFWSVLRPVRTDNKPGGSLAKAIDTAFGSFDKFKEEFTKTALSQFGAGWAWLVADQGKLKIGGTPNQDNPLMDISAFKGVPLLGLDVWEHAYYLHYQNKRVEYVNSWWSLVNWDRVQQYFDKSDKG
ncbi:superoxide dismutase [Sphingobacterium spiritivorum]|uniref:Superoxide dismutase n=1 Tax=Sphingobacterium spiritivorum ATCC 33861 TaxID=525373 RepID=D7VQU7_SPHSI|nr:superoxide dismutase [Sphingobacterium spiritivorum]EFK56148.1 Tat pathway signal sequence domain protein [Sphingobacterium spiritivorum ATCC 33861]QQT35740.1 superoxide dismutase [Sphingobacterium spiritivorum]WQD32457.1 superoxide dismutase [Sphingobacterium spiritivorum]SUJ09716.1 Superoxide dismutase [Mn] [Sphingobacterium spiritivorum]